MKKNDILPVELQGIKVTNAVVETVNAQEGWVDLVVQPVRVRMAFKMQLTDEGPVKEKEIIIDEVERTDG